MLALPRSQHATRRTILILVGVEVAMGRVKLIITMQGIRCGPGHSAVGEAAVTVHTVVRTLRHQRAAAIRSHRCHADFSAQLGQCVGVIQRVAPRG